MFKYFRKKRSSIILNTYPESGGFSSLSGVQPNTNQSGSITVSGINTPVSAYFVQGSGSLNASGGAWASSVTVSNGNTLTFWVTAPSTNSTTSNFTIRVGTRDYSFSVTTAAPQTWLNTLQSGAGVISGDTFTGTNSVASLAYCSSLYIPHDGNWYYFEMADASGSIYFGGILQTGAGAWSNDTSSSVYKGVAYRWYNNRYYRTLLSAADGYQGALALSTTYVNAWVGMRATSASASGRLVIRASEHQFHPDFAASNATAVFQAPTVTFA